MINKSVIRYDYLYSKKKYDGLLVDTNVMLLFIVGKYDLDYIENFPFRRTAHYSKEDFEKLLNVFSRFKKIIITPHTLTELYHLSEKVHSFKIEEYFNVFINVLLGFDEIYVDKNIILETPNLHKFGVADFAILSLASDKKYLVLSDDYKLSGLLRSKNIDSLSIYDVREKF